MEGGGRGRRETKGEKRGHKSSPATRGRGEGGSHLEKGKLSLAKEGRSGAAEYSWRRLHGTNMWKSNKTTEER